MCVVGNHLCVCCRRQGLLFTTAYGRLAGLKASWDPLSLPPILLLECWVWALPHLTFTWDQEMQI